ncbi:hypothetical protein WJX72_010635 [[Myrmecia] bisecta]|uniref:histone acetyltransferase n=1 Tax=[Myrmecia] bisecta TaxID=41462 RepID=A0AAW1R9C1_9CHLO
MGHMGRSVERVSSYLEHASACTNVACPLPACAEVKAMFVHSERCAYRSTRGCDECWRLSTMLSLHSRDCKATMCPVPHCLEEVPERVTDLPDRHQGLGSHPHAERMLAALLSSSPGNGSPHAPSEAGASQQAGYMSAATIMAKSSPLTPLLLQCLSDRHALISVLPLEEPLAGRVSGTAPLPAHELVLVGIFDAWCADVLDGVIPLWDDPPASTDALFQSAEAPALLTRAASMPLLLGLLRYVPAYRGAKVAAADIVSTAVRDSSIILICGPPLDDPAAWAIVKAMLSFLHIAIGSAKSDAFLGQVAESVLMGVSKALTAFVNPSKWHGARAIAVLCISEPSVITILGGLLKSGGSLSKMGAELLQLLLTCFPRKVVEAASDHGHAEAPDLQAEWQSEATPADMRSIEAFSTAVLTADGHILELLFANLQDAHAASSARVGTKAADRKHSGTTCALAQVANPFWTPICALSFHPTAWRPLWAGKAFEWALTMLKVAAAKVPQTLALPQALLYEQTIFCISKLAAIPQLLNHVAAPRHGDGLAELFACLKRPACAGREEAASALKRLVQLSPMDNLVLQPSSRVGVAGLLGAWDDASDDWGLRYGIACMLQRMIRTHQTAIAFFPYVKHVWARLAAAHREAVASMAAHVDASAAALQLTDALLGLAIKYPAATEAFQAQQVGKQVAQAMWMVLDGRSAPSPDPVHDLAQRKCALEIACSALQHLNEEHDYQDEAMQATWEVLGEHVLAYPTQVLLQDEEPLFFHWAASCCRVLVMAILHSPPTQAHFAKQHYLLAAWQQLMATLQLLEEGANPDAERRASLEGCFYALTGLVTCLQEASKSSRPTLTAIQGGTVFRGCKLLVAALTARLCPPDQVPAGREALEHWSVHMRDSCMFFRSLLSRGSTWLLVAVSEDAAVQLISTLHGIMRVSADLFDMYKAKSAPADARLMTEAIRGTAGYIITTLTYFPDAASILRRCKDKGQSLRAAMNFRGVKSRLLKPEALKMLEGLLQASEQDTEAEATAQAAADALVQEEEAAAQRSAAAQQKKKLKKKAKQKRQWSCPSRLREGAA